jgi:hypothetical protein
MIQSESNFCHFCFFSSMSVFQTFIIFPVPFIPLMPLMPLMPLSRLKKRKRKFSLNRDVKWLVKLQQGFACARCEKVFDPALLSIDHRQPLSQGGKDELPNLHALCSNCHREKTVKEISDAFLGRSKRKTKTKRRQRQRRQSSNPLPTAQRDFRSSDPWPNASSLL